ncbi:MAG TPA: hypothetical protein VIK84_01790 [Haloplasmataceae bacterium]
MPETCLKKFKVAVEVANFICYVKYVDKTDKEKLSDLVNTLYDYFANKQEINKNEIAKLVELHSSQLNSHMLKEEKFGLPYNPINNKYLKNIEEINDSYSAPFLIRMSNTISNRFDKNTFMNHFTDIYKDSLFLLDIRYYGVDSLYYEVDFGIYLNEKEIYLKSEDPKYVTSLLEQYDLKQIIDVLGIKEDSNYSHYQEIKNKNDKIKEIYPYNSQSVLEQLVDFYETGNCIFVNNIFLNSLNFSYEDLIKPIDSPKLIVVLERQEYNYFNQYKNQVINRLEYMDNNTIMHIDEYLFREAIGNMAHVLMMNDYYYITLNRLDSNYDNFLYLAKSENKDLQFFNYIVENYNENKKVSSYIDRLLLFSFVYDEKTLNSNLNYFLANTLKITSSFLKFGKETREQLPFTELQKLIQLYYLALQLNKKIELTDENKQLLLCDMLSMIKKVDDQKKWDQFIEVVKESFKIFNIDETVYETEIYKLKTLLNIKRIIFEKEKDINFILDTSVLIDEPDIFHKYFDNNSIVVHSIIQDELEHYRVNNINAVRAMRNINYLKNSPTNKINYIKGEKINSQYTKLLKVKVFEDLMRQLDNEGKYPVLVSNDSELLQFEKDKANIIELNHLPLLLR